MTPEQLAALHAACFGDAPRPWAAAEFADLLDARGCFLLSRPGGFLFGRVIFDEAELLTLAVLPEARRRGLGRELAGGFVATSSARGAVTAFLEVAADNHPARQLYSRLGWREVGRRPRYYRRDLDALVMRLTLRGHTEGS